MGKEDVVESLWQRLETWLHRNVPSILTTLQPGATEDEIQQAEGELQVELPGPVREFYRIHNGQTTDEYGFTEANFFYGWQLPHLRRVVQQWKILKEVMDQGHFAGIHSAPDPGVRDDWWNIRWIPITQNCSGDHLCLDLAPANGGHYGQIISMWHDAPERTAEAASFLEWIERFAVGLEQGAYVYSKGYGGILAASEAAHYD